MVARPGRRCGICTHEHLASINSALASGRAQSSIAAEHELSRDALSRHYLRHMPLSVVDGVDLSLAPENQIDLVDSLANLRKRLMNLLGRAEKERDTRAAVLCIREAVRLIEVYGRLTGVIDSAGVRISINTEGGSSDAIRRRILEKLAALSLEPLIIEPRGDPVKTLTLKDVSKVE